MGAPGSVGRAPTATHEAQACVCQPNETDPRPSASSLPPSLSSRGDFWSKCKGSPWRSVPATTNARASSGHATGRSTGALRCRRMPGTGIWCSGSRTLRDRSSPESGMLHLHRHSQATAAGCLEPPWRGTNGTEPCRIFPHSCRWTGGRGRGRGRGRHGG